MSMQQQSAPYRISLMHIMKTAFHILRVNHDSRNSFLEEYVGPVDGNSSGRFLYAIEHLIQNDNVSTLKELKYKVSA